MFTTFIYVQFHHSKETGDLSVEETYKHYAKFLPVKH
jgi:hypothetical protein